MERTLNETQLDQKAQLIINAVDKRIEQYNVSHLYIGKVGDDEDFKDRYVDHINGDCYTFMWELAKGSHEQIAQMEDFLIRYYKKHNKKIIDNENEGSGGKDGGLLYVCLQVGKELTIDDLQDDTSDISEGFPIRL